MSFKNLEDEFPEINGIYTVEIVGNDKRYAKANWENGKGFTLIDSELSNDEWIEAWI